MNKKTILILFLFIVTRQITFGQEVETILSAPDNWKGEIIPFPLGFAPSIDFIGFEDLRFSPGWSDSTSNEFWAYIFVWYIEKNSPMNESKLTQTFNKYYDGLMGADINNKLDKTQSQFTKTNEGFTGKMRVYDRFFTKDYITLNIKVTETFCPETNKQIILCKITPKAFDDDVWNIFDDVKLKVKCN